MEENENNLTIKKTRDLLLYVGLGIIIIGSIYFAFNYIEQRT